MKMSANMSIKRTLGVGLCNFGDQTAQSNSGARQAVKRGCTPESEISLGRLKLHDMFWAFICNYAQNCTQFHRNNPS